MPTLTTRSQSYRLVFTFVGLLATTSISLAQRPNVRPHFDDYSFDDILIAIDGRGAWFVPEYGGDGDGAWLVNGSWGSDRILIYNATPLELATLSGSRAPGPSNLWNAPVILVAEFQTSGGKTIQVEWAFRPRVKYVVIDTHDGDDYVEVTTSTDCWIELGKGYDIAVGGPGNDYIENTSGSGEQYAGNIYGGDGADTLVGNVTGGGIFAPITNLYGGPGIDTFIFNDKDRIRDNINGESDAFVGDGFDIVKPDLTYKGGRYVGMKQITVED